MLTGAPSVVPVVGTAVFLVGRLSLEHYSWKFGIKPGSLRLSASVSYPLSFNELFFVLNQPHSASAFSSKQVR